MFLFTPLPFCIFPQATWAPPARRRWTHAPRHPARTTGPATPMGCTSAAAAARASQALRVRSSWTSVRSAPAPTARAAAWAPATSASVTQVGIVARLGSPLLPSPIFNFSFASEHRLARCRGLLVHPSGPHLCVCVCVYVCVYVCVHSLQLCLTLCSHMGCSPPGSSVHGILQARILEWVALPSSRRSSQPRNPALIF